MINVKILKEFKSIKVGQVFDLPDFCVLTGKNGSGKSHLFEAMSKRDVSSITIGGTNANTVNFIRFNGLNPTVGADCTYRNLLDEQKNLWNTIKRELGSFAGQKVSRDTFLRDIEIQNREYFPQAKEILKKVGDPNLITEEVVVEYYTIRPHDNQSFFSSQFASIFKLYANRLETNDFNAFRNVSKGSSLPVLSQEEFVKKYGPKPWDLINEMMANAGLSFRVNNPEGQSRDEDFHLQLHDEERGIEVQVNDLSTGERVLMSLALAIYNTNEDILRPDILLLDEPDSALHPEFSNVLLRSIQDSIVKKAGVKVVISTHSPTTVALADEDSLYQMEYGQSPRKVTKQQALSILLKDLEPLRVSVENRRQVFVESRNDVRYYEGLYPLLPKVGVLVPQFLAASTKIGSNCQDVIEMVTTLRQKGNDLVFGIIDYDNKNKDSGCVFVLGDGERYAIDNYILDPLFVALLLIREKIESFDLISPSITFTSLHGADDIILQSIIDTVCTKLGFSSGEDASYTVVCGKSFHVKNEYFTKQGHELEEQIIKTWPKLNAVKKGRAGENVFKEYVIEFIIEEYPEFLSVDFLNTFKKLK